MSGDSELPNKRFRFRGLLGACLKAVGIALVLAAALGAIYQAIATARDSREYPPPGRLIDVGGHRLHLQVTGEDHAGPTVLLEAGMASFSTNWYGVQTALAVSSPVVSYNRAGLGWSEPGPMPRDARRSAEELHIALERAGINAPYVFAGHSYGGLVARAFTDLYPTEVVGMVLVDASHPDQWAHIPSSLGGHVPGASSRVLSVLSWFGLLRAVDMITPQVAAGLPPAEYTQMKAIFALPRSSAVAADGLAVWDELTRPQVNGARTLSDLPLAVLSVTEQPLYGEVLTALQSELPGLSSNSMQRIVVGATHENLISDREHANVVADTIREVVAGARTGTRLQ